MLRNPAEKEETVAQEETEAQEEAATQAATGPDQVKVRTT
jgi:hypothetical protein